MSECMIDKYNKSLLPYLSVFQWGKFEIKTWFSNESKMFHIEHININCNMNNYFNSHYSLVITKHLYFFKFLLLLMKTFIFSSRIHFFKCYTTK